MNQQRSSRDRAIPCEIPREAANEVEAWLAAVVERQAPLSFRDLRRGVQSLSARYVERREGLSDALSGKARRGAFATYYACLHLMTTYAVASSQLPRGFAARSRWVDLGAGSGAASAGLALASRGEETPEILAIERSGFGLREARHTYSCFGLRARCKRAVLPAGWPRPRDGDGWLAGWFLNELSEREREVAGRHIARGIARGVHVLALEPLAQGIAPWWDGFVRAHGLTSAECHFSLSLPAWIESMDRATGLDHELLGVRVAWGPA